MIKKKLSLSNTFKDGFLLILPLGITLWFIHFIWTSLRHYIPDISPFLPIHLIEMIGFRILVVDVIFVLTVLLLIFLIGMITSTFIGNFFRSMIEDILFSQTFISPIYKTFKKMAEIIFPKGDNPSLGLDFSKSILVPYPNESTKSIGFITANNANHLFGSEEGENWLTVYVPSAPVISAGFYLICRKKDMEHSILSSGKAMRTIISVGSLKSKPVDELDLSLEKPKKGNVLKIWFFNGLLFLTPFVATFTILNWIFHFLWGFISGIIDILPPVFSHIIPSEYYTEILSICLIVLLTFLILLIGFVGESAFGLWIKSITNRIFHSIPMFNTLYSTVTQIVETFSPDPSKNSTFNKAVLVPFPTKKSYVIGFITGENCHSIKKESAENYLPIFIPTTPIPTTGWFLMVPKDDVLPLNMTIEEAFSLVISGGILANQ